MHDPSHIVFSIRRPSLRPRRGMPATRRSFMWWSLRDRTIPGHAAGETRKTPLRHLIQWHPAFFRLGSREWFLPSVVTLWHRDPETDGTDSSCRNRVRERRQRAIKEHRFIAAAVHDWWCKHYDLFHVHHWHLQLDFAQALRRRLFTRCATCGGRSTGRRVVNHHVVVDRDAERNRGRTFRDRWFRGEVNLHHWDCADVASIRATKAGLPGWLEHWGQDEITMRIQREREPYYGCYAWWREAILGEDPQTAAERAAKHVQRSCHACTDCASGLLPDGSRCTSCDGSGFPRVERPIPAEVVG